MCFTGHVWTDTANSCLPTRRLPGIPVLPAVPACFHQQTWPHLWRRPCAGCCSKSTGHALVLAYHWSAFIFVVNTCADVASVSSWFLYLRPFFFGSLSVHLISPEVYSLSAYSNTLFLNATRFFCVCMCLMVKFYGGMVFSVINFFFLNCQ